MRLLLTFQVVLTALLSGLSYFPAYAGSETNQHIIINNLETDQTVSVTPQDIGSHIKPGDHITTFENTGRVLDLILSRVSKDSLSETRLDITGTYVSDIRGGPNYSFQEGRKLVFTLKQSGDDIIGADANQRKRITGTRKGSSITFKYLGGGIPITGVWIINSDGTKLEGNWTNGSWDGKWNLTRLSPLAETLDTDIGSIKGKLVSDKADVSISLADIEKIEITQSKKSRQSLAAKNQTSGLECKVSEAARDAIQTAGIVVFKAGSNPYTLSLMDQAREFTHPPECDNDKAIELANKAGLLAAQDDPSTSSEDPSTSSEDSSTSSEDSSTSSEDSSTSSECWGLAHKIGGFGGQVIHITFIPTATVLSISCLLAMTNEEISGGKETAYLKMQQYRFVSVTRDNLARDMAQGGGEYLTVMAYLQGCPIEIHDNFARMTQRNFNHIFPQPELEANTILSNLEGQLAKDPLLTNECKWVS